MKIRRKMRQKRTHGISWALVIAILATVAIGYGAVQGVLGIVNSWLTDLPSVENSDAFNYAKKTRVYANDGTTLLAEFYLENREPITIEQVSPYVLRGTVDTEDERFYEHNGVDPQGIARALFVNLGGGALEGASTITQQFVRQTILSDEANDLTIERKVREAQLAIDLEKIYTKDQVLMMYLNTINYGDGAWGIEAAARHYFQKTCMDLTLAEAATLVGIPQSPNYLNPVTNPDACFERRNLVLDRMLKKGDITQEEHDAAQAEPLNLNVAPSGPDQGIYAYPYFTSYVRQQLLDNFSQAEVFKGGLTVYTTIDPGLQEKAEIAAQEQYDRMSDTFSVALTCIDPSTGYIKAMVGGKNYEESEVNLALGLRQPGSSFKPFTLVAAIEQGINPSTKIDCGTPITIDGWTPENYGGANYGIKTIQQATAMSSNIGYVRLNQQVTPAASTEVARRMGITSEHVVGNNSEVLGTGEVSTLEMASAYSVLAANGAKRDPVAITQVINGNGETIYQHEDKPQQVLTPEVSYATTKVLETVFGSGGTAGGAGLWSGQPCAGKTGTSEDWCDSYLVGYTPQLSTACWIGNKDGRVTMPESLDCTNLWHSFMTMALEGQPIVDFATAADPPYTNKFNDAQKDLYDAKDPSKAPSVVGMTLEQATAALAGYEAEYVEDYSDSVPAGSVISQSVVDGKVRIVVSKGPNPTPTPTPTPTPPNVVGMTQSAATAALAGYSVSIVQDTSSTVPVGTVISQSVSGNTVTLVVSSGPPPTPPPTP